MGQRCAIPGDVGRCPTLQLTAALECENDVGGRFTLRLSGDSHQASCLSAGAATSCGTAAGCAVAHRRHLPWRERPPSPRARYGLGARWKCAPSPPPSRGSLPNQISLREGSRAARGGGGSPARPLPGFRVGGHRRVGRGPEDAPTGPTPQARYASPQVAGARAFGPSGCGGVSGTIRRP